MSYSQNSEEKIILDYFDSIGIKEGHLLSMGENDGINLSNCFALLQMGWTGVLVEPSPKAFLSLLSLHGGAENEKVLCFNVAISDYIGEATFYESGEHLGNGDTALLSTLNKDELDRWDGSGNTFTETKCLVWDFKLLQKQAEYFHHKSNKYDFLSIDVEGEELKILPQIDFNKLGIKLACIEWNSKDKEKYDEIMLSYGFKVIHQNAENLIYAIDTTNN